MTVETLEHLEGAPIDEVACGVVFAPLEKLDPLVIGTYWGQRSDQFPGHSIRTPVRNVSALMDLVGAVPPMRAMLVSSDDQFVLQLQTDRFYLNWRRRGGGYPRFRRRTDGDSVLAIAMSEFERFESFCEKALSARPQVTAIELAKIDVIREGVYWHDLNEVGEMLPCTRDFLRFTTSQKPSFNVRFSEPRERGGVGINIALGSDRNGGRVLTLETRLNQQLEGRAMEAAFQEANLELNAVFAALIPKDQREKFFKKQRST